AVNGTCSLFTGPSCDDGNACTQSDTCQSGVCAGANKVDGTACDDGNACTQSDTCQAGVCVGANHVICALPDQCHNATVCDPPTGLCSPPAAKVDGAACNDGNACTQTDTCQAGLCVGANHVICALPDQCHNAAVCDPATALCLTPAKPDGTACDNDGN